MGKKSLQSLIDSMSLTHYCDVYDNNIDRIATVPPFPGLWQFCEGQGFKQWTGDDSKGLMKVYFNFDQHSAYITQCTQVYLPALVGLVPDGIVHCVAAFLDFCYIACQSQLNEDDLKKLDDAISCFHQVHEIFIETNIREHLSLP